MYKAILCTVHTGQFLIIVTVLQHQYTIGILCHLVNNLKYNSKSNANSSVVIRYLPY